MVEKLRRGMAGASLGRDLLASVVVFLVALPLCMGIAVASGVPPALGLITGVVGGLVVGFVSGQPLQVSGPAAGLTVLVFELVNAHGIGVLGASVLVAGGLQVGMGLTRLGRWFRAFSPAVIQGMLAGIGVLIVVSQVHVMLGFAPRGTGTENLAAIPVDFWKTLATADGSAHHVVALLLGLLAVAVLVLWVRVPGRLRLVPAPLVAVAAATALDAALGLPARNIALDGDLLGAANFLTPGALGGLPAQAVLVSGASIALIASAETLLCASAVDKLHDGPRTKYNKELVAQGVGNSVCGLFGALPMTGVVVRSKANIDAGARTRLSAILHGGWLLAFVALLPFVLNLIPVAALAAVLVHTGFKLVSPRAFRDLWRTGRAEAGICLATLVAIVATNLLEGVLVGVALALIKLLWDSTHLETRVREEGDGLTLSMNGAATFVRLPQMAETLESLPAGSKVRVESGGLGHVDHASRELISDWKRQHEAKGGEVVARHDPHDLADKRDAQDPE